MPDSRDVSRLLAEAAVAPTIEECRRLVGEAETVKASLVRHAAAEREVDLANAIVAEHLTPVRVHEHHTAATDWIGEIATTPDTTEMTHQVIASASLWYGKTDTMVKQYPDEFGQQALGQARKLAGSYGSLAEQAEHLYLTHAGSLHEREVRSGAIKLADQAGQPGPEGTFPAGGNYDNAVDGPATSSERAPAIQALENNGANNDSGSDVVPVNDPGLGQADPTSGVQAQETISRGASMQHAQCPTCGGHGRVAVRAAVQKEAFSGLDQVDQVVDPSDTQVRPTPLPVEVAFPLIDDDPVGRAIAETEQQLAEREQRKGASLKGAQAQAARHAQQAYLAAMREAGYDASGWAGDMGAGGYGPGEQDGGNAPSSNLGQPNPVYGPGGDQGNRPLKPFGADEANDETNQPSTWAPGQPTQLDLGGRVQSTDGPPAPGFPNPPLDNKQSRLDPEIAKAQEFIRARQAFLAQAR